MRQYAADDLEMRFEPLEVTPDLLLAGLSVWDAPIARRATTRLNEAIRALLESPWDAWPATIRVTQISMSTEPVVVPTPWDPPEITRARVSIVGFGWAPNEPVI